MFALATGGSVPSTQLAAVEVAWPASRILRRDRLKTVAFQTGLALGVTAAGGVRELVP